MRIGLYAGRALPKVGGAELVVDRLATRYARAGHDVTVVAPRPGWFLFPEDSSYPYSVFRYPPHLSKRYCVKPYRRYLFSAHERHQFDVLHCHEVYPHLSFSVELKKRCGLPLVVTSHGGELAKTEVREKVLSALCEIDAAIALSDERRRAYLDYGIAAERIVDIPNGVDEELFEDVDVRPASLDARLQAKQYCLFLGRFTKRKGVATLLEAYARLSSQRELLPLAIAGYGREEQRLRRLATKLGLGDKVLFLGAAQGELKRYLLQNAYCTIVPTQSWEACSLVTLESFAAGTPVIGTDVPGLGSLIKPGDTGLIVPPADVEGLARAIADLLLNVEQTKQMGVSARRNARRYRWDHVAEAHLLLYGEIAANTPSLRKSA